MATPNNLQGIFLYIGIQLLQNRLNYPKVGAKIFDSAWRIFDIIDGLDEKLSALKSCRCVPTTEAVILRGSAIVTEGPIQI